MKKSFLLFVLGCCLVLSTIGFPAKSHATASIYSHGSFIQPDVAKNWTSSDWIQELNYLKETGNNLLILGWTAYGSDATGMSTVYPTNIPGYSTDPTYANDVVATLLSAADSVGGIDIWLALNLNNDFFNHVATFGSTSATWLSNEFSKSQELVKELWDNYHASHPSLKGFYFNYEMDNVGYQHIAPGSAQDNMKKGLTSLANFVHNYTGTTIAVAPFVGKYFPNDPNGNYYYDAYSGVQQSFAQNSAALQATWTDILASADIDYLIPQDGTGAGCCNISEVVNWLGIYKNATDTTNSKAVKTHLWVVKETFHQSTWSSMDVGQIVNEMTQVSPIVENIITFTYDHYQSPKFVNPLYHATYKSYYNTGIVDTTAPTTPTGLNYNKAGADMMSLIWNVSTDNMGAPMYYVYRDGVLIGKSDTNSYQDKGLTPNTSYHYAVQAIDAAGNSSPMSSTITLVTLISDINLSQGKTYTSSMAANATYSDTGGTELTDGIFGAMNYADPAWQGRWNGGNTPWTYSFTIDLGSLRRVDEFQTEFLKQSSVSAALPNSVEYQISNDNINFTSVATLTPNASRYNPPADNTKYSFSYLTNTSTVARYVKIIVTQAQGTWSFIGEATVKQVPVNWALYKPYTSSIAASTTYPDTGRTELTDGVMASTSYADTAWQGRNLIASYNFVIDLGATTYSMSQFESTFLRDDTTGAQLPTSVTYSVSDDNITFNSVGTVNTPSSTSPSSNPYRLVLSSPVSGRYVKIQVNSPNEWSFIDEVKVLQ